MRSRRYPPTCACVYVWVMRKTYIHIKTKKKKSVSEATTENHKTNVNIPKGHRPPPNPQPAHAMPTNAHSQTGPLVPNVIRNARNHGEGTAHAWRLASAPPGTQTVLVFRPSKNQTVLVFRPSKNQTVWFFTPQKNQIVLVFRPPKNQIALVFLWIWFWYFGGVAASNAPMKILGSFGNEIKKTLILKNVSWNLLGNRVLYQKPKIESKLIFLHKPFLVFLQPCA